MKILLTLFILLGSTSLFGQSVEGKLIFDFDSVQLSGIDDFSSADNHQIASGTFLNPESQHQYSWVTAFDNQQVTWSKKIKTVDNNFLHNVSVEQLNGSLDVIVSIAGTDANTGAIWYELMRLGAVTGNVVWSKKVMFEFGNGFYMFTTPLQINEQNEILVTHSIYEYLYAAKFSENGNLIFSKRINNIDSASFKNPGFSFIETTDGGYLGTLKDNSFPTLIKLNADFSIGWSKLWNIEGYSHPRDVIELSNGKFAVGGIGDLGFFIAILSSNGTIENYQVLPDFDFSYGFKHLTELTAPTKLLVTGYGFCFTIDMTTGMVSKHMILGAGPFMNFDVSNGTHVYQYTPNVEATNTFLFTTNFEIENTGCNPFYQFDYTSQNVTISPEQLTDSPTFYIENSGNLMNNTPIVEPLSVTLVPGCFLATEEVAAPVFELFPNPISSGELLSIRLEKTPAVNEFVELTDVSGNVILRFPIEHSTIELTIPPLAAGLYFIRTGHSASQKLMVK